MRYEAVAFDIFVSCMGYFGGFYCNISILPIFFLNLYYSPYFFLK